ncbi:MAG: bifunctional UDP-sugar hydrolase/5'-nucleotidase [Bdellovibrionota bacterium]
MIKFASMTKSVVIYFIGLFLFSTLGISSAMADTKITILHTGDIHGHFTNKDSPIRLGGISKLKTKVDFLRKQNASNLLLDAGDWTEGTIFYTLNSGEANHRMMEAFGFDAIVFGNHEWLVGPKELYDGFAAAEFKVPVLAANLNLDKLPENIPLGKYMKPYVIKEVAGKKIGVLGISTFEMIFDPFFEPGRITEPVQAALKYVKILREIEKVDIVIVLTHIGVDQDKKIAESVSGIDLIVGGHTHILTKKPIYTNGVPIVHAGFWAQYLGEYELTVRDSGKVELTNHKIHQIDNTVPENAYIEDMVIGFQKRIEAIRGNVFNDKIFESKVNLPLCSDITEDVLGNWAVDSIRKAGKTEAAFDVGQYFRRDLFTGTSSTVDFYNMFPHVWSQAKGKNWTIFNMDVRGETLQQLINLIVRMGKGVKVSNADYRIDGKETYFVVKNMKISGERVESNKFYKISATEGILQAFDFLKRGGADVGIKNVKDTGVEAWTVIKDHVVSMSPVTTQKAKWEGRVRTIQPDLYVPLEQVEVIRKDEHTVEIRYKVINAGMEKVPYPTTSAKIDLTPLNTLDEKWLSVQEIAPNDGSQLKPGQVIEKTATFKQDKWISGYYPVEVESNISSKEFNKLNNKTLGYFILE